VNPPAQPVRWPAPPATLRVSRYERVASLLLALLVIIGLCVGCLLVIWLTNQIFVTQRAIPVMMADVGGGSETGIVGESKQLDSPNPTEVAQESDYREPEFQQTLAAVSEAVAARKVDLDDPALTDQFEGQGGGRMQGTGTRVGRGRGEGLPGYPRAQRWEIRFSEGNTLEEYARELGFFKIEIGALSAASQILYATELAGGTPRLRNGRRADEDRLYMSWTQGKLQDADRELLSRAGINGSGKVVVQFYPPEVEQALAVLEEKYAGHKAHEIQKTIFGVRPSGAGFAFHVISQKLLPTR
jgi:hypothetical protein